MNKKMIKSAKGFTLIELMIVVAIIGILAAIAVPKFADLITKSKESAVKGSLGAVRSAISIYYSDNEGLFPSGAAATHLASALTTGTKYLKEIPSITVPQGGHSSTNSVAVAAATNGAFLYTAAEGDVVVDCTHNDTKGTAWSQY